MEVKQKQQVTPQFKPATTIDAPPPPMPKKAPGAKPSTPAPEQTGLPSFEELEEFLTPQKPQPKPKVFKWVKPPTELYPKTSTKDLIDRFLTNNQLPPESQHVEVDRDDAGFEMWPNMKNEEEEEDLKQTAKPTGDGAVALQVVRELTSSLSMILANLFKSTKK